MRKVLVAVCLFVLSASLQAQPAAKSAKGSPQVARPEVSGTTPKPRKRTWKELLFGGIGTFDEVPRDHGPIP